MTTSDAPFVRDLSTCLVRDLDTFVREVELLPDDELLWRTASGVSNSVGNLALHCAGNLQHYVGALLGGTGYVRDRPREFAQRAGARGEIVAELGRARHVVATTLAGLSPATLDAQFPETVGGVTFPTRRFLLHLAVHLGFHLGQADYLRRTLGEDARTADTVSVKPLA